MTDAEALTAATPWERAMARLRAVRDALNALDAPLAAQLLSDHDRALREAFAAPRPPFAVSEVEALHRAQGELLDQLKAVQRGVAAELTQTRRVGDAARAYLSNRGA
jgi:hypothetical protein